MTAFDEQAYELHLAQARRTRGGLVQWGSRNAPAVKALQQRLSDLGYATEVDGQWGAETEKQFRAFQHATGLKTDGKLGPKSLEQLLKSKPKAVNPADPSLDAIQRVVAPGMAQPVQTSGLGRIRAQQRGGGTAVSQPGAAKGRRPRPGRPGGAGTGTGTPPKGAHGGTIDTATGAETATAATGPIGSTNPDHAHTPRAHATAAPGTGAQPAQNSNPEFNKLHPREGGKFAKKGDSGEGVQNTQEALNRTNQAGLATDGQFGPKTDKAVRAFQKANKLRVDGIVGPKTSAALRLRLKTVKPAAATKRPPGFQRK